jgi:hypothetical protein
METINILDNFISQAHEGGLKTSEYPREYSDLRMRVSFGMGAPARVPWIGFLAPEMSVSHSVNPVYLYYKGLNILILAYGVSETYEATTSWPIEITGSVQTISAYLNQDVPRYGDSFVFKAYKVKIVDKKISYSYFDAGKEATSKDMESDLTVILDYYKKLVFTENTPVNTAIGQSLFYMEKQLEDFIIHNWNKTEFGKRFDLIIEEGELLSQQYRTDIGPIDILAKDKKTKNYVVIELKRNQTSDDTVGQLARYMGWIKENKKDNNVKGIIIAGEYDKKLDYALKVVQNVEVFLYRVDFTLNEFKGVK